MIEKRKAYVDNLRWIIVILVVIFHVVDIFNSTGVKIHFNSPGIPAIDTFAYFVYPWFMGCLFIISGMSARYALQKNSRKVFAKERVFKLLIPFVSYMILFSYLTAAFSFTVSGGWKDFAGVPQPILYIVLVLIGMGHLWFILELFVISMVFLLVQRFDKNDKLWNLGNKINIWTLLILYIPLLASAQILNFLGVFRNLFFLLLFLIGYFIFSHEQVQETLKKYRIQLLAVSLILFAVQLFMYYGKNFAEIVNKPVVMLYTWVMILAVIGNGQTWFDFSNNLTRYLNKRSFLIYLFHYLPMILIAYFVTAYLKLPVFINYILVLVLSLIATFVICEVIARIPYIRLLFGVKNR